MCKASEEHDITPGTHVLDNGDVEILIPLDPVTKKNSQKICIRNGRRFIATSDKYKQYERDCLHFLKELNIGYPVNIEAHYYVPTRRRIDITNLHSALHDILVRANVIQDDNCKIVVSTDGSRVRYRKNDGATWIRITRSEERFEE